MVFVHYTMIVGVLRNSRYALPCPPTRKTCGFPNHCTVIVGVLRNSRYALPCPPTRKTCGFPNHYTTPFKRVSNA